MMVATPRRDIGLQVSSHRNTVEQSTMPGWLQYHHACTSQARQVPLQPRLVIVARVRPAVRLDLGGPLDPHGPPLARRDLDLDCGPS